MLILGNTSAKVGEKSDGDDDKNREKGGDGDGDSPPLLPQITQSFGIVRDVETRLPHFRFMLLFAIETPISILRRSLYLYGHEHECNA